MNKTIMNKKTTTIAMVTIIASLAVLMLSLNGVSTTQNAHAVAPVASVAPQIESSDINDTDTLQAGPGNVDNNNNSTGPEDNFAQSDSNNSTSATGGNVSSPLTTGGTITGTNVTASSGSTRGY